MPLLRSLIAAASLGSMLLACADGTGPVATGGAISAAPTSGLSAARGGKRTPSSTDGLTTTTMTGSTLSPLRFAAWAPPLESYDTTFVVRQGKASSDTLFFKKDAFGLRLPYMVLTVPKDAQFVDASGQPVPKGDVVNIAVHADSQLVWLSFGPHGSRFSKTPATVKISWFFTDLVGREPSDLKLWYQPDVNTTWNPLATQVDLQFYWLASTLDHFSNYAVAY